MQLPIDFDVQLQRVPAHATSNKQPGKVHLVLAGHALHDLAQNTANDKRWPWKHETERVTTKEWRLSTAKTLPGARSHASSARFSPGMFSARIRTPDRLSHRRHES
jgi:hypothetical protein